MHRRSGDEGQSPEPALFLIHAEPVVGPAAIALCFFLKASLKIILEVPSQLDCTSTWAGEQRERKSETREYIFKTLKKKTDL